MKDWRKTLIGSDTKIIRAMEIIDQGSLQIALVVGEGDRLVGLVTDGDIRRGLLRGVTLEEPVVKIMQKDFTTAGIDAPKDIVLQQMRQKELRHIPVIDGQGRIIDLKVLDDLIEMPAVDNTVVLMAGGQGSRLKPLTLDCPKPLLKVGSKPLMETILENFIEYGFHDFFISVNYKAEMIKEHFQDGSRWGVSIRYVEEDNQMGTAGSLALLPEIPEIPLIVMNADLLTKVNFQHLLDFHQAHRAKATMCIRDYHFQCPYGVIKTDQHRLTRLEEKPTHSFFVNAGIYVLEPEVLRLISKDARTDMTEVFEKAIDLGYETVAFPIREYWMDIGMVDDFERANGEYSEIFK
ncbi:MAG: nucleotidyltransferase family protein [Syntrophorhabdaceae bacterium]|nr:nucleotidyltransferase family protein [Syntrophorhabdaceae bacterium]